MQNTPVSFTQNAPGERHWLLRPVIFGISSSMILLVGIIILSAALHFSNIQAIGDSNTYYTAAVKSMLQSWHNFFFISAEPGGSVTVDKPPLGLWVETAFAWALGLSGFTTSLPNILAGILSIPLLYHLVKRYLSVSAALIAALVLAVTPVVFATDRNNTTDGLLTFVLLLAAWAFMNATETGKLRYLLLGSLVMGLGFNIKMLQAFLPLPSFYALYLFANQARWSRKVLHLLAASLLLAGVSLSWAFVVDSVPPDQRPYIGSSQTNSVLELVLGYNGLARLLGPGVMRDSPLVSAGGTNPLPQSGFGQPGLPPAGRNPGLQGGAQDELSAAGFPGGPGGQGSTQFSQEVGEPGLLRFFQVPLATEMSWLLPLALAGLLLAASQWRFKLPIQTFEQKAFLLWGGWLLTCLVFFSIARFYHAYYMIMLVPALGSSIGLGMVSWQHLFDYRPLLASMLIIGAAALTTGFQIYLARILGESEWWIWLPGFLLLAGAVLVILASLTKARPSLFLPAGSLALLAAIITIPLAWSYLTVYDQQQDMNLPGAYGRVNPGKFFRAGPDSLGRQNLPARLPQSFQPGNFPGMLDENLIAFLQENTQNNKYLLAVPSANQGARFVLATGRPVLYMGGFSGSDPVVDVDVLEKLVEFGDLRYVEYNSVQQGNGIGFWLRSNCSAVESFGPQANQSQPAQDSKFQIGGRDQSLVLFDCANKP